MDLRRAFVITPKEIQNKVFSTAVRGYKQEDVDKFLDALTLDWDRILLDNDNLKDQVRRLKGELERYKTTEQSIVDTLESARALMDDISSSAEKRANLVLRNAELDAELVLRDARETAQKLNEEYAEIKGRVESFRENYKKLLESELKRFDTLSSELFDDLELKQLKEMEPLNYFTDIDEL